MLTGVRRTGTMLGLMLGLRRETDGGVSDCLRSNGQLVSNGTCGSMAVVLGASDRGVGWFDGPINASSTVTYVTQRLYFVGVSI